MGKNKYFLITFTGGLEEFADLTQNHHKIIGTPNQSIRSTSKV
jgi:hypothetical protein